jgi:hydrogenase maturation protein HypF
MGRLFDAVASLIGLRHSVDYEAQAAMELEALARSAGPASPYSFELRAAKPAAARPVSSVADPGPLIRAVVDDVRRGTSRAAIAARFHATLASLVGELAQAARRETGLDVVALGGGVWQNALLLDASVRLLEEQGFTVLRPRRLPPNDGGIALGQILVGSAS